MNMDQDRFFKQLYPLDGEPGPARIKPSRAQAMVGNALDTWQQKGTKAPRRNRGKMVFLAAAIVAFASAAAGLFHAWTVSKEPRSQSSIQASRVSERASGSATIKEQLEAEPSRALSDKSRRSARTRETKREAEDLLQIANQQRQQGRWRAAERTYRRVSIIYPKSPSAYVALIAAASIRLEQLDDARGALTLYNQAVQIDPSGSLDIEARIGIARAWQRLGKREREIKSLRRVLRKHDSGPMVQQAKQRLEVISRGD